MVFPIRRIIHKKRGSWMRCITTDYISVHGILFKKKIGATQGLLQVIIQLSTTLVQTYLTVEF